MDHGLGLRSSRRARTPQSLYPSPCWPASDHRHISESGDLTNGLFVKEASSASSTDGAAHNAVLQCRARRADKNLVQHSNANFRVPAATPKRGSLRVPLAVHDHLPQLHGAEFQVLLVLSRHQARGGGRDQKPFPYTIPQIQKDTGLCPRAISHAISRLDKHHLILRVKKHGALPNRYRVLLEPAAPQKIQVAKKPARASKRPKATKAVEVKSPVRAVSPQKRTGGRRRKEAPTLLHVERPNLFEGLWIDPGQPDQS